MDTFQFRNLTNIIVETEFPNCYISFVDEDGLINEYRIKGFPNLLQTHIEVTYNKILKRPNGEIIKTETNLVYREYEWQGFAYVTNLGISFLKFGYTQAINGLTRRLAIFEGDMEKQGGYQVYGLDGLIIQPVVMDIINVAEETVLEDPANPGTYLGQEDGSLEVSVVNGVAPFRYKIGEGAWQDSSVFSGLAAGTYTVTCEDSLGTQRFTEVIVPQEVPAVAV